MSMTITHYFQLESDECLLVHIADGIAIKLTHLCRNNAHGVTIETVGRPPDEEGEGEWDGHYPTAQ